MLVSRLTSELAPSEVTNKKFEKSKKSPKLLQATVPLSQSLSCSTDCKLSPMLTSLSSIADKPRALNPKLKHNGTGGKVPSQSFTCYLENLILSLRQCQLPISIIIFRNYSYCVLSKVITYIEQATCICLIDI